MFRQHGRNTKVINRKHTEKVENNVNSRGSTTRRRVKDKVESAASSKVFYSTNL